MPGVDEKEIETNPRYPYPEPALVLKVRSLRHEGVI